MKPWEVVIQHRPLSSRPDGGRSPKPSQFKASWSDTKAQLQSELGYLQATDVVLELDVAAHHVRNDGALHQNVAVATPAVALSFRTPKSVVPLRYPCNTYWKWQDNVRAIVLTLAALRAVDRYGATMSGEQYRGFAALPAPRLAMTVEQAGIVLHEITGYDATVVVQNVDSARAAARAAAAMVHPDASNGSHAAFVKVQEAKRVLSTYHGVSL